MANEPQYLLKASIVALIRTETGGELKKNFEAVFSVDEEGAKMPWFVLCNFLAPRFLNEKLGPQGQGWIKIYEAKTLKLINRTDPTEVSAIPLRVMTEDQLDIHILRWELPVKREAFHDLSTARRFVKLYQEDPAGYQTQFVEYINGKGRKYPELDKFRKTYSSASQELRDEFDKLELNPPKIPTKPSAQNPFGAGTKVGEIKNVVVEGKEIPVSTSSGKIEMSAEDMVLAAAAGGDGNYVPPDDSPVSAEPGIPVPVETNQETPDDPFKSV